MLAAYETSPPHLDMLVVRGIQFAVLVYIGARVVRTVEEQCAGNQYYDRRHKVEYKQNLPLRVVGWLTDGWGSVLPMSTVF